LKVLFVGGEFTEEGGSTRDFTTELAGHFLSQFRPSRMTYVDGGDFQDLRNFIPDHPEDHYDVIIWMPKSSHTESLRVEEVKRLYPHSILVTTKTNYGNKYSTLDMVARMLKVKSNLMVEVASQKVCRVLDPLGNEFRVDHADTAEILAKRIKQLQSVTRIGSASVSAQAIEPPDNKEFFEIIQSHASRFHDIIHANASRFLGNVSFRCERGFPSYRDKEAIFVSKRDVDKRFIDRDGFVALEKGLVKSVGTYVKFHGLAKPSVDAPIHLALYENYQEVNFMLHSHVYVEGAPFTDRVLPCGAMEEVEEIVSLVPSGSNFAVNLRGHGSIILASDLKFFGKLSYTGREIPEIQVI
jgi:hypothetical protein